MKKIKFLELSQSFNLLEINLNELIESKDEFDIEPNNDSSIEVSKSGRFDAILYWYDLYLTQQIVVNSLNSCPDWHSAAFVIKQPIFVTKDNRIHISCMFTNGFLRFKNLKTETLNLLTNV